MVPAESAVFRLHPDDAVVLARRRLRRGDTITDGGGPVVVADDIPAGHKVTVRRIAAGEAVRKYGQIIGFATRDIPPGAHAHVHNVDAPPFERDYEFCVEARPTDYYSEPRTFLGYARPDGRVGARNYVAVVSTANCSATVCHLIAERFRQRGVEGIDGVIAITHDSGCGHPEKVRDHEVIQRLVAGYARHPNVAAYILVGLGCEINQMDTLAASQAMIRFDDFGNPPAMLTIQAEGGIRKTVESGVRAIEDVLPRLRNMRRTPQPLSKLQVAVQCGGSDAYSGMTANPAVGWAADELVRHGGTVVLSETSEIYGAEHLLVRRARTRGVGERLVQLIEWWERYTEMHGVRMTANPSPGNQRGGITTIYEKSLGAIAKGGTTTLNGVFEYAERITESGLVVMDGPGYDPASVTGQVASGCQVVVFTTGRGSAFGSKPAPTIKVATNTPMFEHMEEDMDLNAGAIIDGRPLAEVGEEILDAVVAVASGERTKSELQGMGDREIVPWLLGPTL